jgi:hypothetical protein
MDCLIESRLLFAEKAERQVTSVPTPKAMTGLASRDELFSNIFVN